MIYGLHAVGIIILILFQSVFWQVVLPFNGLYDLFVPVVVCVAIFRPPGEMFFVVFFAGLMMDSLTGGAFGLYTLTYIWIFVGLKAVTVFLDKDSFMLQLSAVLVGLLLETGFFAAAGLLPGGSFARESGALFGQLFWAILTAPFIISGWCRFVDAFVGRTSSPGGKLTAGGLP